jgi:hypothetical protein
MRLDLFGVAQFSGHGTESRSLSALGEVRPGRAAMTNNPWRPVCNSNTTIEELARIIEQVTADALVDAFAQIEAATYLSPLEQAAARTLISPVIRAQTEQAIVAGWQRLQDEAEGIVRWQ